MFPELARDDVFCIETRRLWLRWPRMADAEAVVKYAGEKAVAEMTARIPHPMTRDHAVAFILGARQANAEGEALSLAIAPRNRPNDLIGVVSIMRNRSTETALGYWLAIPFWGQGLATEAAQALVDITFDITRTPTLNATVVPLNGASRRVLEKCGFAFAGAGMHDAPARGGAQPVDHFRLDRSTWRSLKGWRDPRFQHADQMQMAAS